MRLNMNAQVDVRLLTLLLMTLCVSLPAAAKDPIYTGIFSNTALKGYDAVSYFQGQGQPVKGNEDFQTTWRGAQWLFSSQQNLDLFTADPLRYAPQYGGYCAYAAAEGNLVKGDPLVHTIVNDKLYLNYNQKIDKKWQINREEFIQQADSEYPQLVDLN